MPTIMVPRVYQGKTPIVRNGLKIPEEVEGFVVYEVTKMQEFYWMGLTPFQRRELAFKADQERKDLREYL